MPYSNAIGSTMYTMVCCRPNLAYAMSFISRFLVNLGKPHWEAAKWVLRYLCGTIGRGLNYVNRGGFPTIESFVDLDFVGSIDIRRFIIDNVFKVFGNTINWKANLEAVVALSSTEAEYTVAC